MVDAGLVSSPILAVPLSILRSRLPDDAHAYESVLHLESAWPRLLIPLFGAISD